MNESLLDTARAVREAGNLAEAARLYGEILRADRRNFEALYRLASIQFERAQFEDARGKANVPTSLGTFGDLLKKRK